MPIEEVKNDPPVETKSFPARLPMGTILGEMADAMDSTRKTLDRYKHVTVMQPLKNLKEDIGRLTEEELAALKKVAVAKEYQDLWSYGHLISSAGYASMSILFGCFLISFGEERGKNLIYGGSALLANTLMDHLGGWTTLAKLGSFGNQTVEETLKVTLPIASTVMTMVYNAYSLAALPVVNHKALFKNIDTVMSWVNMIVQAGNISTKWIKGQAERQLMIVQGKITVNTMKIEPLTLRNENLTNTAKQVNDAIKGGIKKIITGTSAIPMGAA